MHAHCLFRWTLSAFALLFLLTSCAADENRNDCFSLDDSRIIDREIIEQLARVNEKRVLLYFTGFACVNCRKMDEVALFDERVCSIMEEHYILIPLFVDDRTVLEENQWRTSERTGESIKTVGQMNSHFQTDLTKTGGQPLFAIVDESGSVVRLTNYLNSSKELIEFLTD